MDDKVIDSSDCVLLFKYTIMKTYQPNNPAKKKPIEPEGIILKVVFFCKRKNEQIFST